MLFLFCYIDTTLTSCDGNWFAYAFICFYVKWNETGKTSQRVFEMESMKTASAKIFRGKNNFLPLTFKSKFLYSKYVIIPCFSSGSNSVEKYRTYAQKHTEAYFSHSDSTAYSFFLSYFHCLLQNTSNLFSWFHEIENSLNLISPFDKLKNSSNLISPFREI